MERGLPIKQIHESKTYQIIKNAYIKKEWLDDGHGALKIDLEIVVNFVVKTPVLTTQTGDH